MEQGDVMLVQRGDIQRVLAVVTKAVEFHVRRDEMNAALHLARETRLSPLTSGLQAARDRLTGMHP
jgi:hypothetical protein